MNDQVFSRRGVKLAVIGMLVAVAFVGFIDSRPEALFAASTAQSRAIVQYDDQGRLIRPTGYREWIYVGTPLTPNELNPPEAPFPEFHNVYIDPESYEQPRAGSAQEGLPRVAAARRGGSPGRGLAQAGIRLRGGWRAGPRVCRRARGEAARG